MEFGQFFNKQFTYALVGATIDKTKYGYIVLKNLAEAGFKVVGVNPKYKEIDNIPCYPALELISPKPEVVVFVVPPAVGLGMLDQIKQLGINKVWFQPGAESDEVREKIKNLGLSGVVDGSCIMVCHPRFN
jgi:predicted CoA-binding protein